MQNYKYTALDCKGEEKTGTIKAKSESKAIQELRRQGYYPTKIQESSGEKPSEKTARPTGTPVVANQRPGNPANSFGNLGGLLSNLQKKKPGNLVIAAGIICFVTGFLCGIIFMTMTQNNNRNKFPEIPGYSE